MLWSFPGDCHVGLRPPRNDVVIFGWSFCIKNPRSFRTGEILFRERRSVGLRPPLREEAVQSGHPGGCPYGILCPSPVGNGLRAVPLPPPPTRSGTARRPFPTKKSPGSEEPGDICVMGRRITSSGTPQQQRPRRRSYRPWGCCLFEIQGNRSETVCCAQNFPATIVCII